MILSSPAVRARKTAREVSLESGYEGEIEIQDDFYPGDPDDFIEVLAKLPGEIELALIVAHNPGLETFVDVLTGESARMPTAALAHVSLPIEDWSELSSDVDGKLLDLWWVKELK